ncbi:hypothetical protein GFS31_10170 [Leptolyngbya sp. BL0902]|nr:hypothetical protein GFS31_10170 [Leptolyngbya sp. BL0902]
MIILCHFYGGPRLAPRAEDWPSSQRQPVDAAGRLGHRAYRWGAPRDLSLTTPRRLE